MLGMETTHVLTGLRDKRARIAGEIQAAAHALAERQEQLATLDAVIRMFVPDCHPDMIPPIRPISRGLFFKHAELPRLCIGILRNAACPMGLDKIVEAVIEAKGFTLEGRVRRHISDSTRGTLMRMTTRGVVRRIIDYPETWWELA
jgi:hypothetical protein